MNSKLKQLIANTFGLDLTLLDARTVIMDLDEWDSLKHMEFIVLLENEFAIELTGDEIASMQTIEQMEKMVATKVR